MDRTDWWIVFWITVVVVVVVGGFVLGCRADARAAGRQRACVHAGYADCVRFGGNYYCIGFNTDGAIQIVALEAVMQGVR